MTGRYALIIGNNEYDDPRLAQLRAPGKDAEDLARVLMQKELCNFDDVQVVINQTEPVVRAAIDDFYDQKGPQDLLVLYFSGHGVRDESGSLYLAVKNTNRSRLRSTGIKSDFIHEVMEQSRSKRQVLILDCCNSGAFSQGSKGETGGSVGTAAAFGGGYGRIILTASDSIQYALEGDRVIGETDNSLFTHFLVRGLQGEAEVDSNGCITVDALYDYAYEQVKSATPNQTPSKFSSRQEGEIVLRKITDLQEIKAAPLPEPLVESLENPLAAIRIGAVQELARLLNGKHLGMRRSAREALEHIAAEDDSRAVQGAALAVLEPVRQAEQLAAQKAEEERREAEERARAEELAEQQAEAARLAEERAQAERQAAEARLTAERAEQARRTQEDAERQRRAQEQQDGERRRLAQERAEAEAKDRAKREEERMAALRADEAQPALGQAAPRSSVAEPAAYVPERAALPTRGRSAALWTVGALIVVAIVIGLVSNARAKANRVAFEAAMAADAQATSDAITAATGAANDQATQAAVSQATSRAIAQATSEARAQQAAAVTAEAAATQQSAAQILVNQKAAGSVAHDRESLTLTMDPTSNSVVLRRAAVKLSNFVVEATFVNPSVTSAEGWDYGFIFRDQFGNSQYRLYFRSSGHWRLENHADSPSGDLVQDGDLTVLNTGSGDQNLIQLVAAGTSGKLYVNRTFVATLDLGARREAGDVAVGTGFVLGDGAAGAEVKIEGFGVWELP